MESGGRGEIKHKTMNMKDKVKKEAAEGDDEELVNASEDDKKKSGCEGGKKGSNSGGGGGGRICQAEKCKADMSDAKQYHKRHKVCEHHAKAQVVMVAGIRQRFHELSDFDETKRSCRRQLAGHNQRRRKTAAGDSHGEGSRSRKLGTSNQLKEIVFEHEHGHGQVDERGRIPISIQENASYKHFQII